MLLTAAAPQGDARRRALAAWSATGAAAGASGLVLGGVLTDLAGWRLLFWANVPLAVLLLLAVGRTAAVAAVVTGAALLEGAAHRGAAVGLLLAGAAAAAVLPAVERRAGDPLVTPAAGRDPHLRSGALASFANTATTSSAVTLATLHVQQVQGHSASAAGLALVPFSLCVVVGAALAAHLLRRLPTRTAASVGLTVIAAGNAALLADSLGPWVLPAAVGVSGLGIGVSSVAATSLGTDVAPTLQGTAGGVLNTAAQLGTALGVAAVLLVAATTEQLPLPLTGTPLGWLLAATAAAAAAVLLRQVAPRAAPADDVPR
ncbi:MFS transporter [Geodermatophilus sp. URMC 65]